MRAWLLPDWLKDLVSWLGIIVGVWLALFSPLDGGIWAIMGAMLIAAAAIARVERGRFFRWAKKQHETRQADPSFLEQCPSVPLIMPMYKRDAMSLADVWRRAEAAGIDVTMWKQSETWTMRVTNPDGTSVELRPSGRYRWLTEWRGIESALLDHMHTLAKTEELDAVAEVVEREKAARFGT